MAEGPSPSERVAASYKRLAASAATLSSASDELAKSISALDEALKRLNLGVPAWQEIHGSDNDGSGNFWSRDIGYAKIGGKWGIALRTTEGNHNAPEYDQIEEWLFNDAPRWLRIDAIDKIPDLIDKLIAAADETSIKIKQKTEKAQELAAALSQAASDLVQQRRSALAANVQQRKQGGRS